MAGSGGQAGLPHGEQVEEVSLAGVVRVGNQRKEGEPGRTVVIGEDSTRRGGEYKEVLGAG